MRNPPYLSRALTGTVSRLAVMLLLATFATLALPDAATAAPAAQGVQFGHPVDLNNLDPATGTCRRAPQVNLLLNNATLLNRTSWIRINFRAAGGLYPGNPNAVIACPNNLDAAYQAILNDFAGRAPWIQVIGLLTQDFWYGSYSRPAQAQYDAQGFANRAGQVACRAAYQHVDVWEIWNEPDLDNQFSAYLEPASYASVLGRTSRAIRNCGNGDLVISAGLVPDFPSGSTANGLISYLQQVDQRIRANSHGGYTSLSAAVDGIGIHPYVPGINTGDAGHSYLNNFFAQVAAAFDRPLYATEFGWPIVTGMDQARQCHNLVNAFQVVNTWAGGAGNDRVAAATWFTLQDFGDPTRNFGLYDFNGNARQALTGYTAGACGVPATPTGVTAVAVNANSIRVSWNDNSTNETGFAIANGVTAVNVGANVTTYTWSGLAPGTYMCFFVTAKNAAGQSPWSTQACATTPR